MVTRTARTRVALAIVALSSLTLAGPVAARSDHAEYRVTIINLTQGQPFTPPLVALHRRGGDVFTVGQRASVGVKEIAENGNLVPLHDALDETRGVTAIHAGMKPVVPADSPGDAMFDSHATFTIETAQHASRLSWVSMLICTNDGFTGVDSLDLPDRIGQSVVRATAGYDAGTERNTERFKDIVGPCQGLTGVGDGTMHSETSNPDLLTNRVIRHHPGIRGGHDLLIDPHDWTNPVAVIVVTRIG